MSRSRLGRGVAATALVNARIHPMGPEGWEAAASAILWDGDAVVAVGKDEDVLRQARGLSAEVKDADGRVVLPGFVDAHMHFLHAGLRRHRPDLRGAASLDDALGRLAAWLRDHPGNDPVTAEGWDEAGWPGRPWPTRADIDLVAAEAGQAGRPVVLRRIDGHVAVGNSAALPAASARWPHRVDMDAGVLLEEASLYLNEALPAPPEVLDAGLQEACRIAHSLGVTALGDYSQAPFRAALLRAARRGTLSVRVASSVYAQQLEDELARGFRTGRRAPGPDGAPSPFLKDAGLKVFLDGSLGAHTAALREGYEEESGEGGGRGTLNWSDGELERLFRRAHAAGVQVHAHAIGDAAIDQGLQAFSKVLEVAGGPSEPVLHAPPPRRDADGAETAERPLSSAASAKSAFGPGRPGEPGGSAGLRPSKGTEPSVPSALRHRFEHFEIAHDGQLDEARRLGIVASSQPNFVGEWSAKGGMYEARLGPRFLLNNRFRTMKRKGVRLAFGSDGMPFGPLVGLQAAVRHPTPGEALGPLEAAWHYTWMAAWSLHWEGEIGSLAPGKKADLVVLRTRRLDGAPEDWGIHETVVGGRTVHQVGGPDGPAG